MENTRDSNRVNVVELIDGSPISRFQWRVIFLCMLIAAVDGFDAQVIAFVGPELRDLFSIAPEKMGWLFSSALIGLAVGALGFSPLADRIGRKPVILLSCIIMGVFSIATAFSESFTHLLIFRFLTGLGLGGAMPNINTLTAEYSPARFRATLMTLMFIGFPLGAALGGAFSAKIIAAFGWQSVFILGGVLPLLLSVLLIFFLPESLRFMAVKKASAKKIAATLSKAVKSYTVNQQHAFFVSSGNRDEDASDSSPMQLFQSGRAKKTGLIWLIFFSNLLVMYSYVNWMPSLMSDAGMSLENAIFITVMSNIGGMIGGIVLAPLVDRIGATRVLITAYILASVCIPLIGYSVNTATLAYFFGFLSGAMLIGSQFCMNALVVNYYPTSIRSTALGWSLAVGRVGAILGPIVIGSVVSLKIPLTSLLTGMGLPALICAAAVFALSFLS